MACNSLVRGAAISGVMFVALASGAGIASAAPYGGVAAAGVTTSGGGAATFTGSGFGPGTAVALTVTSCGTSKVYNTTATSAGTISVPTTSEGQTSYSATGTDGGGLPLTVTSSALLSDACAAAAVLPASGSGGGLPFTGFELGAASAIGIAAIGTGLVLVAGSRRRRRSEAAS